MVHLQSRTFAGISPDTLQHNVAKNRKNILWVGVNWKNILFFGKSIISGQQFVARSTTTHGRMLQIIL